MRRCEKAELDGRADSEREDERAHTDLATEQKADREHRQFEPGAHHADPLAEATRADQHQRVAWAGPQVGADIEDRPDTETDHPEREHPDPGTKWRAVERLQQVKPLNERD